MKHPVWELWTQEQQDRMTGVLSLLGQEDLYNALPVVHVAGTNGKGSVCAYLSNILLTAGYRVGLFISPHLYRETERIRVNGKEVPQEWLSETLHVLYNAHPSLRLFDAYLVAALRYFEQEKVEIAIIETGLGGALDATTALLPALSCTCTIGLDHTQILGDTLTNIAIQKGGIAKPGVPMVFYPIQAAEARKAFLNECTRLKAPVLALQETDLFFQKEGYIQLDLRRFGGPLLPGISVPLLGKHQAYNAATAALCAAQLHRLGFPLFSEDIVNGIGTTVHPGRLEILGEHPLILLDGAHNVEGAQALAATLPLLAGNRPVTLLTAMMADKDAKGVASVLAPLCHRVITTLAKEGRGLDPQTLAELYREKGTESLAITSPEEALSYARKSLVSDEALLIAGSLYLPESIGLRDGRLPPVNP